MVERRRGTYWVYLLICDDGSYYTGYSGVPFARFAAHAEGHGARYTRMHKPDRIVYLERHRTRSAAMKREREIKTLTHKEKRSLAEETKLVNKTPQIPRLANRKANVCTDTALCSC